MNNDQTAPTDLSASNLLETTQGSMTQNEFLLAVEEILDLPTNTLSGQERLEDLNNWDSIALIRLIVLVESNIGVNITPDQVIECTTVADLMRVAHIENR